MKTLLTIYCSAILLFLSASASPAAQWKSSPIITAQDLNMFAVSGNRIIAGTYGTGIFYSDDRCKSWKEANTGLDNGLIYTIYADNNKLYATTEGSGIYMSTNGGDKWTAIGPAGKMVLGMTIFDGVIYAGVYQDGVMISTDNGANWSTASTGLTNKIIKTLLWDGTTLYAGSWGGGVFISSDKGASWTASNKGSGLSAVWAMSQADGTVFIMGQGGLFASADHGANWKSVSNSAMAQVVTGFAKSGNAYFAVAPGTGVFASTDKGASWKDISDDLPDPNIRTLGLAGNTLIAGGNTGAVYYRDISTFTSVEDMHAEPAGLAISPNPASDFIEISSTSIKNGPVAVDDLFKIYNSYGQCVIILETGLRPVSTKIDISALPSGLYFVRCGAAIGRFVKM